MRFSAAFVLLIVIVSCNEASNEIKDLRTNTEEEQLVVDDHTAINEKIEEVEIQPSQKTSTISFQIIENEYGFGYQIYDGSKLLINQPHIPAIQGMKGFETKEKAEIVAKYVVSEVDKGNFPPTVSEKILRDLGAI